MPYISFKQVMDLPQMKQAKILGGLREDMDVIRCGHVIELPDMEPWIDSGELIFMTGIGLKNPKKDLKQILEAIHSKSAAGLVLEIGPYITVVPDEVIHYAQELEVPLIALPFEARVNEIMTGIYMLYYQMSVDHNAIETILRRILYYEYDEDAIMSAIHLGYRTDVVYRSIMIQQDQAEVSGEKHYSLTELLYHVTNYIQKEIAPDYKHFILIDGDCLIVMLPIGSEIDVDRDRLGELLQGLQEKIAERYESPTISIGVGCRYSRIEEFKKSTEQAKHALALIHACGKVNEVRFYEKMGIYRLLFQIGSKEELTSIVQDELGVLLAFDEKNHASLVETLEVYLDNDKNIGISANQLFLHRNTLKYRINKAQSLLNLDLENANICFQLRLAFKIRKFLNEIM